MKDYSKIVNRLITRRDDWQKKSESANSNDFYNKGNYQAMASELNYLIRMIKNAEVED